MASGSSRNYRSSRRQDELLEAFYRDLEEEDEDFLGNTFFGDNEDIVMDCSSDSDSDNEADQVADVLDEEPSGIADCNAEIEFANNNNDNEIASQVPSTQIFASLEAVLDENNHVDIPIQPSRFFKYANSKKTLKMTWKTQKNPDLHKRGSENICKTRPVPRGASRAVKTPLESFKLFFTDEMVSNIVA